MFHSNARHLWKLPLAPLKPYRCKTHRHASGSKSLYNRKAGSVAMASASRTETTCRSPTLQGGLEPHGADLAAIQSSCSSGLKPHALTTATCACGSELTTGAFGHHHHAIGLWPLKHRRRHRRRRSSGLKPRPMQHAPGTVRVRAASPVEQAWPLLSCNPPSRRG